MVSDNGPDDEEQSDDTDPPGGGGGPCTPGGDDGVLMFDAEEYNLTWSRVRPGEAVNHLPGLFVSEETAAVVRELLFPYLKNRHELDAVQARTDDDGSPYLWLRLGAAGVLELVGAARVGFWMRGGGVDDERWGG